MRILLVDVDSKIPNIALMKLSTRHKNLGDEVEIKRLNIKYYKKSKKEDIKYIDARDYDKVYVSVIFPINKELFKIINNENIEIGGTGFDIHKKLPDYIEVLDPDYSIYPENDMSIGFITRGCIRNCYFCFVPKKEGGLCFVNHPENIVKHKKTMFLDNNFLAYKGHKEILQYLIDKKIRFTFKQGLDLRLIDEENAYLLSKSKYIGEYIFAYDDLKYKAIIEEKTKLIKKYINKDWKLKYYIYCHPNMKTFDIKERIMFCRNNKILPYLMRDISCYKSKLNEFYIDLAGWCNQVFTLKKFTFEEYIEILMSKKYGKTINPIRGLNTINEWIQ